MKTCTKCHADKPLTDFNKKSRNKDGLDTYCRACRSDSRKQEWSSTPEYRKLIRVGETKAYRDANPVKSKLSLYKSRAKSKGRDFELTLHDFEVCQHAPCAYCDSPNAGGFDRIDSNQGYTYQNVTPCCTDCNMMKGSLTHGRLIQLVTRIADLNQQPYSTVSRIHTLN